MGFDQSERIRAVVHWFSGQSGQPLYKIGSTLGYNNRSSFSQVLNGSRKMPMDFPQRVAALDPRINIDYLLGDSEEMLLSTQDGQGSAQIPAKSPMDNKSLTKTPKRPESGIFVPSELVQMISDLSTTIKDQQKIITTLVETWAKKQ